MVSKAPRSRAAKTPISSAIPPLVLGTGTFNVQFVSDPSRIPYVSIVERALELGINAFDTSPYYGPSEMLLGDALSSIDPPPARDSYFLITKAGRIASNEFDYSPAWIRYSVCRSLERLHTTHLDLVYTHDVEFVTPDEVVAAVQELRRLRDAGVIRYVGISGYPVPRLLELAEKILRDTGEPIDAVLSYSNFCIQNGRLGADDVLDRFKAAGVDVVINASMLSMGLLTTRGVDDGPMAKWHPAPSGLRKACKGLAAIAEEAGEKMEEVALHWALGNWAKRGSSLGTVTSPSSAARGKRVGVSVMGVTKQQELEDTWRAWGEAVSEGDADSQASREPAAHENGNGLSRTAKIQDLVESRMWPALGHWRNWVWESPDEGWVNNRAPTAAQEDDGVLKKWSKLIEPPATNGTAVTA